MRSLITIVALASSLSAVACPNLTGTYATCRSTTGQIPGSRDMTVTQSGNSYTVVSIEEGESEASSETIIADGMGRTESEVDPESGMTIVSSSVASCQGDALVVESESTIEGQSLGTVKMTATKSGNTLTTVYSGSVMGTPINDTLICE